MCRRYKEKMGRGKLYVNQCFSMVSIAKSMKMKRVLSSICEIYVYLLINHMDMNEPIDWQLYRSLLAVLEEGSLSAAARRLGLTQPTLSRHIATLEEALGQALFIRSRSGLSPTEAATRLLPFLKEMEGLDSAIVRAASASAAREIEGRIRISSSEIVGAEFLPIVLRDLGRRYPKLRFELSLSNRVEDLSRHEADIAVRMVKPREATLVAKRLGEVRFGFFAHRLYLQQRKMPRRLGDLEAFDLIGYDRLTPELRSLLMRLPPELGRFDFRYRASSDLAQLAMIRAGLGVGICQKKIGERDKELVHLLPRAFSPRLEVYLVMHEELRGLGRIRAVFDGIAEGMRPFLESR